MFWQLGQSHSRILRAPICPSTIYIEEEIDLESGKFKLNEVVIGSTYEMHGEPISRSPDATYSPAHKYTIYKFNISVSDESTST